MALLFAMITLGIQDITMNTMKSYDQEFQWDRTEKNKFENLWMK